MRLSLRLNCSCYTLEFSLASITFAEWCGVLVESYSSIGRVSVFFGKLRALKLDLVVCLYPRPALEYSLPLTQFPVYSLTLWLTFWSCTLGVYPLGYTSYFVSELRFLLGLVLELKHVPKPNTFPPRKNPIQPCNCPCIKDEF